MEKTNESIQFPQNQYPLQDKNNYVDNGTTNNSSNSIKEKLGILSGKTIGKNISIEDAIYYKSRTSLIGRVISRIKSGGISSSGIDRLINKLSADSDPQALFNAYHKVNLSSSTKMNVWELRERLLDEIFSKTKNILGKNVRTSDDNNFLISAEDILKNPKLIIWKENQLKQLDEINKNFDQKSQPQLNPTFRESPAALRIFF